MKKPGASALGFFMHFRESRIGYFTGEWNLAEWKIPALILDSEMPE
jgi:hypothetical protein